MVKRGMIVKIEFEVQATKASNLALDAYIFRIIVNVLLKEISATVLFFVGCHVRGGLASTIDAYDGDLVAAKIGHGKK